MIIKILSTVVVALAFIGCKPPTPPDTTSEDLHRLAIDPALAWLKTNVDEFRSKVATSETKLAQLIDQEASESDIDKECRELEIARLTLAALEKRLEERRKGVGVEGNIDCISN